MAAGAMDSRAEMAGKLARAKSELPTAGKIHRRDLTKHIRRLERELRDYDRFRREAGCVAE